VTGVIVGDAPKHPFEKEEVVRVSREFSTLGRVTRLLGALCMLVMMACGSNDNPANPATTQVFGTATLPAGSSGDLSNATVSLYTGTTQWINKQPVKSARVTGSGPSVTWSISDNIVPGDYYLDIWKDVDNSASWSLTDFVGWYGSGPIGTPSLTVFSIAQNQSVDLGNINMLTVSKKTDAPTVVSK
jgi:hypothetical protein